jgi:hypothetical protein
VGGFFRASFFNRKGRKERKGKRKIKKKYWEKEKEDAVFVVGVALLFPGLSSSVLCVLCDLCGKTALPTALPYRLSVGFIHHVSPEYPSRRARLTISESGGPIGRSYNR